MGRPREIANRQFAAYNARDLDAFAALHAEDVELFDLGAAEPFVRGQDALRRFYAERFGNPGLRCTMIARMELGEFAIDRETVSGVPGGDIQFLAIYQVRQGRIRRAWFVRERAGA